MFNKGDRVKITSVTRTRTIFQNAEVTPGITKTHNLNVTGTIAEVYQDPLLSYEVEVDGMPEGRNHIEVNPNELEKA